MAMEKDLTLGGDHTMQYTDDYFTIQILLYYFINLTLFY